MQRESFFMIPRKIFEYRLPPIPFAVYSYLQCCNNKQNGCYPSRQTIAKACSISGSSVGRAIKQLEELRLVKTRHNFGDRRQQNNSYELLLSLNTPGGHDEPPLVTKT